MDQDNVNLMTAGGVAAALGVSRQRVYAYVNEGILRPAGKNAYGHRLYSPDDVAKAKKALHDKRFAIAKPA
jgi:DNA-binding transcriptional MerR regulator